MPRWDRVFSRADVSEDVNARFGAGPFASRVLSACLLPVMMVVTIAALQGASIRFLMLWVCPAAVVVALVATAIALYTTIGRVFVREDAAAVQTMWDVLFTRGAPTAWFRVIDFSSDKSHVSATIGLSAYRLSRDRWPQFEPLCDALRQAHQFQNDPPRANS